MPDAPTPRPSTPRPSTPHPSTPPDDDYLDEVINPGATDDAELEARRIRIRALDAEIEERRRLLAQQALAQAKQSAAPPPDDARTEPAGSLTDPRGWTLQYIVQLDNGESMAPLTVEDCFDIDLALHQIASWVGVCRGNYSTRAPKTLRQGLRGALPIGEDFDGAPKKCPRRGSFTIAPANVLDWFGYYHVPGGRARNLVHREGVEPPESSGQPAPTGGSVASGSAPAADPRLDRVIRLMEASAAQPRAVPHDDLETQMKALALKRELSRHERDATRETEEEEARRTAAKKRAEWEEARAKKQEEWEEEDRRAKRKLDQEMATRRAEAESERAKDDAAHRRRMDELRADRQHELAQLEAERKNSSGDPMGLAGEILEAIREEGGVLSLLTGRGSKTDDDTSLIGMVNKVTDTIKNVAGMGKLLPVPTAPTVGTQGAAPQITAAPQPEALNVKDDPNFTAILMQDNTAAVKTPVGWGKRSDITRHDLPLLKIDPAFTPNLEAELARLLALRDAPKAPPATSPAPPALPQDEDDFPLADEGSKMFWGMLNGAEPALVPIVEALVEQLGLAIDAGAHDVRTILASMMRAYRGLEPGERANAKRRILDPATFALVTQYLPKMMPAEHRVAAADPAIERLVDEVMTMFRGAITRTGVA